jgi:hypothetical protein
MIMGTIFKSIGTNLSHPLSGLDPMGTILGSVAGKNSTLANWMSRLPGNQSGFAKAVSPTVSAAAEASATKHDPPPGYVAPATPYAGKAASLAGANAGYNAASMVPGGAPTATPTAAPTDKAAWMNNSAQSYINAARNAGQNGWGS